MSTWLIIEYSISFTNGDFTIASTMYLYVVDYAMMCTYENIRFYWNYLFLLIDKNLILALDSFMFSNGKFILVLIIHNLCFRNNFTEFHDMLSMNRPVAKL